MAILDLLGCFVDVLWIVYRWRFFACFFGGLATTAILSRGTEPFAALGYVLCAGLTVTGVVWEWRFRRDEA